MVHQSKIKAALQRTGECLPLEQLEKFTQAELHSHPHVSRCARCQAELALLRSFESPAPLAGEGAAVAWISSQLERRLDQIKGRPQAQRPWFGQFLTVPRIRWLIPAGAVVAIALATFFALRPQHEPELRAAAGNSSPAIYRSEEVEIISPSGDLPEPPKGLEWKPFPGTANYRVSLMEVDHSLLWESETGATSIAIPSTVSGKILPGKALLWRVAAVDAQGRVLATSQVQRFIVTLQQRRTE